MCFLTRGLWLNYNVQPVICGLTIVGLLVAMSNYNIAAHTDNVTYRCVMCLCLVTAATDRGQVRGRLTDVIMTSQDGGVNVMRFPRFTAREFLRLSVYSLSVCLSLCLLVKPRLVSVAHWHDSAR